MSARLERQLARQVVGALESNPSHPFRRVLLAALGVLPTDPVRVEPLLMPLLEDPSWEARAYAIRGIGNAHPSPERILPMLVARIEKLVWPTSPSPDASVPAPGSGRVGRVRNAEVAFLVEAIGGYGTDAARAVPVLIRLLNGEGPEGEYNVNSEMNRYLCDALMRIGPAAAEALPALVYRHVDPNWHGYDFTARLEAGLVLSGAAGDKTEALTQLTRHESWRVRRAAILTLLACVPDPSRHRDTALAMLRDESDIVSIAAAECMLAKGFAREECRDFLLKAADDGGAGDAWTRVHILQRYGFDAQRLIPQLEAEKAAKTDPTVLQNYESMLDALRAGKRFR